MIINLIHRIIIFLILIFVDFYLGCYKLYLIIGNICTIYWLHNLCFYFTMTYLCLLIDVHFLRLITINNTRVFRWRTIFITIMIKHFIKMTLIFTFLLALVDSRTSSCSLRIVSSWSYIYTLYIYIYNYLLISSVW